MTVLLYAVTAGSAPCIGNGLAQRPLRAVHEADLTAVVSDVDNAPSTEAENLWDYEEVVERLMHADTVIPARFGTTADSDDAITAMLVERHRELHESLERVRDAVEFAVHVEDAADAEQDRRGAGPGTAYMNRLRDQEDRTRELDAAARRLFRAKRRTRRGTAYLVRRADAAQFAELARGLGLTLTGPWPPYSFVNRP